MKRSSDRILTTHVGSLVRPPEIIAAMRASELHQPYDEAALERNLTKGVAAVVRKQAEVGVDVPSDGEFGKQGWAGYVRYRLGGLEWHDAEAGAPPFSIGGIAQGRQDFPGFYETYGRVERTTWMPNSPSGEPFPDVPPSQSSWTCTGPVTYIGQKEIARDIANFKAALANVQVEEAFMPVVAPCSAEGTRVNQYYKTDEEYLFAIADAVREEYKAVVEAGLVLQVDDAILPMRYNPTGDLQQFLKWAEVRIDALNHALEGIPEDWVRYHICWGSQNVPHTWDIPLKDILPLILKVKAQAYSLEAANPRHEHEWEVWQDTKLPEGKILIPGLVMHATNIVEHPDLVAQRIRNFARLVGRENVIAGTDCGFSQNWNLVRVHPEVQWAKLEALAEGARLATKQLW